MIKRFEKLAILLAVFTASVSAVPVVSNFMSATPTDADKLHDNGAWGTNFWDDLNNNNRWDSGEPLADAFDASWINPRSKTDNTCWIASASNMLANAGYGSGDAQAIYWDIVNNMTVPYIDGGQVGYWEQGGWQHEALNWYLDNRADPGITTTIAYYGNYSGRDGSSGIAWDAANAFDIAANALAGGDYVGLVINGWAYHAVTFQGYDAATNEIWITDSDRDQDGNDLNQYAYGTGGTTGFRLTDYPDIAVDYFAILHAESVPEPSTIALLLLGCIFLGIKSRGRKSK